MTIIDEAVDETMDMATRCLTLIGTNMALQEDVGARMLIMKMILEMQHEEGNLTKIVHRGANRLLFFKDGTGIYQERGKMRVVERQEMTELKESVAKDMAKDKGEKNK